MQCQYTMARGTTDIDATRARLSRIVEHRIPQRCGRLIDDFDLDAGAVYRINRLQLRTWVDVRGMDDAVIAGRWAALLAGALQRELATGRSDNVRYFESPVAYVAAFLAELPSGTAWRRWWFDEFRFLEPVPPGEVVVRLLVHRPDWIAPVLADLAAERRLEPVMRLLDAARAERLWHAASAPAGDPEPALVERLVPYARHVTSTRSDVASRTRSCLVVWAHLARSAPGLTAATGAKSAVERLVDVRTLVRRRPDLAERLVAGPNDRTTAELLRAEHLPAPGDELTRLVEMLAVDEWLRSPVGGVALVLPALAALGVWPAWERGVGRERACDYVFVVLLKVLGRTRALLALGDELLAAVSGCEAAPIADARLPVDEDLGDPEWRAGLPTADDAHLGPLGAGFPWLAPSLDVALSAVAHAAARQTASRLGRFADSSLPYLASVFFAQPAELDRARRVVTIDGGVLRTVIEMAGLIGTPIALPWLREPLVIEIGGS